MDREELVDVVAQVLGLHECAEYATYCICGKKLYYKEAGDAMSMRRHRAEKIVEALEIKEVSTT